MEVNSYDVFCLSLDGETTAFVSHHPADLDEFEEEVKTIKHFCSVRGKKVTGWTPDKITYPIYALTIRPIIYKSETYVHGETVVWTNGYLITSSGDVYRCNPNFKPFLESDEHDYVYESSGSNLSDSRNLRPLHMANNEWNKDMLKPSDHSDMMFTEDIDATVTAIAGDEYARTVTVSLRNNGTQEKLYSDQSMYVGLDVLLDGEWYRVYHDPNVDDNFLGMLSCNKPLEAGHDVDVEYSLGYYGLLPPGDYRLVIYVSSEDDRECVAAEFEIKLQ
ncbi:MAG: hypothetical protein J5379_00995 [Clostridiales bacterium]|nr:hypothetical protein [Clostridiales bacterium]